MTRGQRKLAVNLAVYQAVVGTKARFGIELLNPSEAPRSASAAGNNGAPKTAKGGKS